MEKSSRNILRRCRQKIVDDLDVTDVLDHLLANEVVNEEQMEEIFSRPTRVARARCLLDVLVKRGPNLLQFFPVINLLTLGPKAFPVFLDSLRDNYSWLVEFMVENHAVDGWQKTVVISRIIISMIIISMIITSMIIISMIKTTNSHQNFAGGCSAFRAVGTRWCPPSAINNHI